MSEHAFWALYWRLRKVLSSVRENPEMSHRYDEFAAIAAKELTIRAYNLQALPK